MNTTDSHYKAKWEGALVKAKMSAAQEISEIMEIAESKKFWENLAKQDMNARFGW